MHKTVVLGVIAAVAAAVLIAPPAGATTDGLRGVIAATGGSHGLKYIDPVTGNKVDILPGATGRPSWSSDGNRLAVQVGSRITVMNSDATGKSTVRRCTEQPSLDPDGGWIACTRPDDVAGAITLSLFVVSLNGQTVLKLVENARNPEWSPDGEWIAYTTGPEIWKVRPDGTEPTLITALPNGTNAYGPMSWSPDGSSLAFTALSEPSRLNIVDIATGTRTVIPQTRNFTNPSWSPDGLRLAASDQGALVLLGLDGGNQTRPTDATAPAPAWQPASVTIRPGRTIADSGQPVTFSMKLAWLGNDQTLYLQMREPKSSWRTVASDSANGQGDASITRTVQQNAWYRVLWKGGGEHSRAWSAPVLVQAHLRLIPHLLHEYDKRGRWNIFHVGVNVIYTVSLRPKKRDDRVCFIAEWKDGRFFRHAWTSCYRTYDHGAKAGVVWVRLPKGFEGRIRATWKGDVHNLPDKTPWTYVRVTR